MPTIDSSLPLFLRQLSHFCICSPRVSARKSRLSGIRRAGYALRDRHRVPDERTRRHEQGSFAHRRRERSKRRTERATGYGHQTGAVSASMSRALLEASGSREEMEHD